MQERALIGGNNFGKGFRKITKENQNSLENYKEHPSNETCKSNFHEKNKNQSQHFVFYFFKTSGPGRKFETY